MMEQGLIQSKETKMAGLVFAMMLLGSPVFGAAVVQEEQEKVVYCKHIVYTLDEQGEVKTSWVNPQTKIPSAVEEPVCLDRYCYREVLGKDVWLKGRSE